MPSSSPPKRNKKFSRKSFAKVFAISVSYWFPRRGVWYTLSFTGSPALDSNTIRIMIDARYGNVINGRWKAGRLPGQLSFVGRGRKTGEGKRGRMKVPFLGRRPLERIDPPSILMVICNSINSSLLLEVRSYRLRFTWNSTFLYIYIFFFSEKLNFLVNRDELGFVE